MPMFITKLLEVAEGVAERIIALKDSSLGLLINCLIPAAQTRELIQEWFVNLPRPRFPRLSQRLRELTSANIITVSNGLSLSRIPAGIFFITSYASGFPTWYPLLAVGWAVISDFFDGVLARVLKQETELGAMLDAGCDKVFAVCCAISLLHYLWWWNFAIFIALDTTLGCLAWLLHQTKKRGTYHGGAQVKSNWLGKTKFCCQGAACLTIMLFQRVNDGNWFLLMANVFAVGSLIRHLEPKQRKT